MLTTVALFTILGSRLFAVPLTHWLKMISAGSFVMEPGRSAMGGLLFGLAGLFISRRYLGIGPSIFNLFAWLAPLGFGVQKLGCFFNGCCYGSPTDLPWGISYPTGTIAHYYQWMHGLIGENDAWSHYLHPVQIYEALGFFIIACLVWRTGQKWKHSGSSLLFSVFLFFSLRFTVGFFIDPSSENVPAQTIWGLKELHWVHLILTMFSAGALLLMERYNTPVFKSLEHSTNLRSSIIYVFIISIVIYLTNGLFSVFELISLDIVFIPAIALTAIHAFKSLTLLRTRLAAATFLMFPVFLITQPVPQDTIKQHQTISDFYRTDVKTYKRIDFGISAGNYLSEVAYNPVEGECGTTYTHEQYKHELRMAGAGISKVKTDKKLTSTMGINLFGGVNRENNLTNPAEESFFLFGVDPYIKYDWKWFGVGAGLYVGNLRWAPAYYLKDATFEHGTRFSPVMPEVSARLGRSDILDLKYNYGFNFPSPFPVLVSEISLGSGFGSTAGFNLRGGAGLGSATNYFISVEGLVTKEIGLNFRYNSINTDFVGNSGHANWFVIGANYRFGFNK